ncbi:MAG: right-handed parallel beta-helix repeat-containing protein [Planctomycetota bacterium]|nr:right-handed parallel beta-helix repeat-containing protein [Planctomycetota bacterium]MDA1105286.1 right-handed parallel beta-helix repeat-containing protein [Planctomycetota bacterium]
MREARIGSLLLAFAATAGEIAGASPQDTTLPLVEVRSDNTMIRESCRLVFPVGAIPDLNGDGVVQIQAPGITVDLGGGTLHGAIVGAPPDRLRGIGIVVDAPGVTLQNGGVAGYMVGILGRGCTGGSFINLNVSDNFAQRLLSTDSAEDPSDWLWPHENDSQEWRTNYGAGLCVESAGGVTIRGITARHTQNGIILDRVRDSAVVDCDCSFLSGWGLAMWRSSGNTVVRNAFDFCVRGYSHGIYNRGQDSAGILVFEQSSNNLFAENSATHCGDGYFSFAGREALGEGGRGSPLPEDHKGLGCNDNVLVGNDFSDAAAHGVEITFSERNRVVGNTISRNAICGVWGGYSGNLFIAENTIERNGEAGSGAERGGVNIEHGRQCVIARNTVSKSPAGVVLWWDEDPSIFATPWARATGTDAIGSSISGNTFSRCAVGIELRDTKDTTIAGNAFVDCSIEATDNGQPLTQAEHPSPSSAEVSNSVTTIRAAANKAVETLAPLRRTVGNRSSLTGRERIQMTEWGPWNQVTPVLVRHGLGIDEHYFDLLGASVEGAQVLGRFGIRTTIDINTDTVHVYREPPEEPDELGQESAVLPYSLSVRWGSDRAQVIRRSGVIAPILWHTRAFALPTNPVDDPASFEQAAATATDHTVRGGLNFSLGSAPLWSHSECAFAQGVPADNFGFRATAKVLFPPGCWLLKTVSDDGIRVLVDGNPNIEDWTHHGATPHEATISVTQAREIDLQVDWFDLDGHATLRVWFEACPPPLVTP